MLTLDFIEHRTNVALQNIIKTYIEFFKDRKRGF